MIEIWQQVRRHLGINIQALYICGCKIITTQMRALTIHHVIVKNKKNILALPCIHVVICLITYFGWFGLNHDWRWFLLIVIDYPFSILIMKAASVAGPFLSFVTLGTLWWLFLSVVFTTLYEKFKR